MGELGPGEVGYLITGVKDIGEIKVGDTVTYARGSATVPLPGYAEPKPMVFSGLFPTDGDDFERLREAIDKLTLNDASLQYEPETSKALGFGFRLGFLGLLHMEIVRERLEREYGLDLVATAPSVAFRVHMTNGEIRDIRSPQDLPDPDARVVDRGALCQGDDHFPDRVHRTDHGADPVATRGGGIHALPVSGAG